MRQATGTILALLPVLALLAAWEILVPAGGRLAFLLGRPSEILATATSLVGSRDFWRDVGQSGATLAVGYGIGMAGGFLGGLLVWLAGRTGRVVEAYLVALGSIPMFALAPLLIFVLGVGQATRLTIVSVSVLIPVALAVYAAARDIEQRYQDLIATFGSRRRGRALRMIIMPGAFYFSLPGLKSAANAALVATFVSEWISAERGLAKFVLASMSVYAVPAMWVGLIAFVLMGVVFNLTINRIEAGLTHWRVLPRHE